MSGAAICFVGFWFGIFIFIFFVVLFLNSLARQYGSSGLIMLLLLYGIVFFNRYTYFLFHFTFYASLQKSALDNQFLFHVAIRFILMNRMVLLLRAHTPWLCANFAFVSWHWFSFFESFMLAQRPTHERSISFLPFQKEYLCFEKIHDFLGSWRFKMQSLPSLDVCMSWNRVLHNLYIAQFRIYWHFVVRIKIY